MKRSVTIWTGVATLTVAGLLAWPVYAHCGKCAASAKDMIARMKQSDVTLSKAISMAEKHSDATALAAFSQIDGNNVNVDVYCLKGDKLMAVTVDASSGKVTRVDETKTLPIPESEHKHEHGG